LKDEPASGLDCSGDFKAAPDIRINGPAAGGGYVLRTAPKVKVSGNRRETVRLEGAGIGDRVAARVTAPIGISESEH
jgi:hypothetical protein